MTGPPRAKRDVYGGVDADGKSTWAPHRRRAVAGAVCLVIWVGFGIGLGLVDGWAATFPDTTAVMGVVAVALAVAVPTWRSWSLHRRFGRSQLVPARPAVQPGETIHAVLEAAALLAQAREVRFELVEMHRSTALDFLPLSWQYGTHVRASAAVPVSAFVVTPGACHVPLAMPVPPDGLVSFQRSDMGFSLLAAPLFVGWRETEHAWEIRASADVEGPRYRARFRVIIGLASGPTVEPAYAARPILIPPSDKIPRRPQSTLDVDATSDLTPDSPGQVVALECTADTSAWCSVAPAALGRHHRGVDGHQRPGPMQTVGAAPGLDPALNPPACTAGSEMFADVPASSPFCRWIEELARRGVVTGCGGGNYCPAQPVTREKMGVFLSVTFGLTSYGS